LWLIQAKRFIPSAAAQAAILLAKLCETVELQPDQQSGIGNFSPIQFLEDA
jgi:hypothetical protein